MSTRLRCKTCGTPALSAKIYRGPGQHVCRHCGGPLALADARDERRAGADRRRRTAFHEGPDWRGGWDRREASALR
jgi:hypothetical protein